MSIRSAWELRRTPGDKPDKKVNAGLPWRDQVKIMRRMLPLIWPKGETGIKFRVIAAGFLVIAAKLITIAMPLLYGDVVNSLPAGTEQTLAVPFVLIFAFGFARFLASATNEIRDLIFSRVEQRALKLVSLEVLNHVHALSLRFHLERQTGGLSRAVERGIDAVEFLLTYLLFNVLPLFLELALTGSVLWQNFNPIIAMTTVGIILAYIGYIATATQWRTKFRREMNTQDREANTRAVDSLINYETVKYFTNEGHELERFGEAKNDYMAAAIANQRALSSFNVGQGLILSAGVIIVMTLAAYGVVHQGLKIGAFVTINAYLLQLYQPLNMLGWIYRSLRQSMTDIEQMYKLLNEQSEIADRENAPALPRGPGRVVFDSVSFSYDPRRPILKNVSFDIPAGKKVAIVGPTGSGKTTLARLLFRFYDPQKGTISIDGHDIRDVTQTSVRGVIGVVPQDTVLFNDSLYYNIAYGRLDAGPEEVMDAGARAQLADFIAKLPDGYRTRVGERGLKLSGGEKQRVAIARVLLKAPEILIFDEATSSLDSRTEQGIQASLTDIAADHTTLVIAHRLSTVVDADEILVLDDGVIVERGDHESLVRRGGTYAAMWNRQLRASEFLADVAE